MRSAWIRASAAAALFLFAFRPVAGADGGSAQSNAPLKGTYAFAANSACLVSLVPFDANGQPTNPNLTLAGTRGLVGTVAFLGNGKGKAKFNALTIVGPPNPATATETDAGNFSYKVSGNSVSLTLTNLTTTYLTGPEAGLTAVVDMTQFTGGISADGNTLAIGGAASQVATSTLSDGSVFFSICETAGSLTKM